MKSNEGQINNQSFTQQHTCTLSTTYLKVRPSFTLEILNFKYHLCHSSKNWIVSAYTWALLFVLGFCVAHLIEVRLRGERDKEKLIIYSRFSPKKNYAKVQNINCPFKLSQEISGEDRLGCSSSAIQTQLGPSSLLEEWSKTPIVFVACVCCRLPPKLGETAKVYR